MIDRHNSSALIRDELKLLPFTENRRHASDKSKIARCDSAAMLAKQCKHAPYAQNGAEPARIAFMLLL